MCRDGNRHHSPPPHGGGSNHFMMGAIFGTIVGAALGLLFAPEEGKETRKKVKKAKDDATKKAKEIKKAAVPLVKQVEEQISPILEAAQQAGGPIKEQVVEKIEQLAFEESSKSKKKGSGKKRLFKGIKK